MIHPGAPVVPGRRARWSRARDGDSRDGAVGCRVTGPRGRSRLQYRPPAAGLLLPSGGVVTSFSAVDAAEGLAAELPGGRSQALAALRTWNRAQDWAVLPVDAKAATALPRAAQSPQVGDQCYSLQSGGGGLALAECSVVGSSTDRGGGPRILVDFVGPSAGAGAPVVNRDGELVGIFGSSTVERTREGLLAPTPRRGTPVVPAAFIIDAPDAASRTLPELRAQHVLREPVVGGSHVVSGGFSTGIQRNPLRPLDQRLEFTGDDPKIVAFISWDPRQRLRCLEQIRVFTADNGKVAESKPSKIDLRPGDLEFTYWELRVPQASGIYYAEVLFDNRVMWREWFRVTR